MSNRFGGFGEAFRLPQDANARTCVLSVILEVRSLLIGFAISLTPHPSNNVMTIFTDDVVTHNPILTTYRELDLLSQVPLFYLFNVAWC